jgi:hypothetical protein
MHRNLSHLVVQRASKYKFLKNVSLKPLYVLLKNDFNVNFLHLGYHFLRDYLVKSFGYTNFLHFLNMRNIKS